MGTNDKSYNVPNQEQLGGAVWSVGGQLDIDNAVAGGVLTIDGVDVTQATKNAADPTNPLNVLVKQYLIESALDGIVAHVGGGQGLATPLLNEVNRIATVASAGDSVLLPPSRAGLTIVVINHGASPAQVFGAGTDTINDVATATGISQMPNSFVVYSCVTAGSWYTESLASGFAGGFGTQSFLGGLIAHAGGGQGAALALTAMVNRFATVGTAGDSAVLPATVANISIGPISVANAGANAMNVFPATGDTINALGANAAFSVPVGKTCNFYSTGLGQWHALLSV